jgi:hypothetical protein
MGRGRGIEGGGMTAFTVDVMIGDDHCCWSASRQYVEDVLAEARRRRTDLDGIIANLERALRDNAPQVVNQPAQSLTLDV